MQTREVFEPLHDGMPCGNWYTKKGVPYDMHCCTLAGTDQAQLVMLFEKHILVCNCIPIGGCGSFK